MARLIFDYGHGGYDSGATSNGRLEKTDVLILGEDVRKKLVENYKVTIDVTRNDDRFISLNERCEISNKKKYDYFISFHRNAFNGVANGVETYVYDMDSKSYGLAKELQKAMVRSGFKSRGVKTARFKVLTGTKAPAILLEVGFIDSIVDDEIFTYNYNILVDELVDTIAKYLKLKPIKKYYRVISGTYESKSNAIEQVEKLRNLGIDSWIME